MSKTLKLTNAVLIENSELLHSKTRCVLISYYQSKDLSNTCLKAQYIYTLWAEFTVHSLISKMKLQSDRQAEAVRSNVLVSNRNISNYNHQVDWDNLDNMKRWNRNIVTSITISDIFDSWTTFYFFRIKCMLNKIIG